MIQRLLLLAICASFVAVATSTPLSSQDKDDQGADAAKPKTHKVEAGPFKIVVEVPGVFEAAKAAEISAETEHFTSLEIKRVVPHGATVKQGDVLVQFVTDEFDDQLKDARNAAELARLSLRQGELELQELEKTQPLDLEGAVRSERIAREELQYFLNVDRDRREKSAAFSLKMSEASLENAVEELTQLEKMYKEDELTEESEEIVLKRARRSVESAEFSLESARLRTARTLETTLPRELEQLRDAAARAELALARIQATQGMTARKQAIAVEKLAKAVEDATEKYEELAGDRKFLRIESPIAGIVFHGSAHRGQWSLSTTSTKKLEPETKVTSGQSLVTVVDPGSLRVRVDLSEEHLRHVNQDTTATIEPKALPDATFNGKVVSRSLVPVAPGKYDCVVAIQGKRTGVMPAMTCTVKFKAYETEQALTVPSSAVFGEGKARYVHLVAGDGHERRSVQVGHTHDGKTEILEGLKAGDRILAEKP